MMYAGSKNKLVQTAELTKVLSRSDVLIDFPSQYSGRAKQPDAQVFSCS